MRGSDARGTTRGATAVDADGCEGIAVPHLQSPELQRPGGIIVCIQVTGFQVLTGVSGIELQANFAVYIDCQKIGGRSGAGEYAGKECQADGSIGAVHFGLLVNQASSSKICSMGRAKMRAMRKASGSEGS